MNHGTAQIQPSGNGKAYHRCDRKHREALSKTLPQRTSLRMVIATAMAFAVLATLAAIVVTLPATVLTTSAPPVRSPIPPPLFDSPVLAGLPPPGPSTRVPVNPVDRFTGKPITAISPNIQYKGYVIAFCCPHSTGYRGGWDRLSEAEKDTYVRGFLK